MAKTKSLSITCLKCGEEWKMGFNRIERKKYTPCPKCKEPIATRQKIILRLEMDKVKEERNLFNKSSQIRTF